MQEEAFSLNSPYFSESSAFPKNSPLMNPSPPPGVTQLLPLDMESPRQTLSKNIGFHISSPKGPFIFPKSHLISLKRRHPSSPCSMQMIFQSEF